VGLFLFPGHHTGSIRNTQEQILENGGEEKNTAEGTSTNQSKLVLNSLLLLLLPPPHHHYSLRFQVRNWYASPNVIRMMKSRRIRLAGCVAWMEEMSNVYNILVGKPKEKRPLGGPRRRWKNNNIMNLREIWWVWTG
jgi:hypothetical protein